MRISAPQVSTAVCNIVSACLNTAWECDRKTSQMFLHFCSAGSFTSTLDIECFIRDCTFWCKILFELSGTLWNSKWFLWGQMSIMVCRHCLLSSRRCQPCRCLWRHLSRCRSPPPGCIRSYCLTVEDGNSVQGWDGGGVDLLLECCFSNNRSVFGYFSLLTERWPSPAIKTRCD